MKERPESSDDAQPPAPGAPKPRWRSLTWWLGQTPEQVAEINESGLQMQSLPLGVRIVMACLCLAAAAMTIMLLGWVVIIPTVGMLGIFGVYYLITGKMMKAPLPLWVPIAGLLLIVLTMWVAAIAR
jgi:hypothetical protein